MKPIYFASPQAFRAWLEANHQRAAELLVGYHKRATGKPSMTWPQSVDEALCYGWIDGVRRSVDENRYTIRFTPRRPTSNWSAVNVARVAELTREGRMRPAGLEAFARRSADRTGVYSFEQRKQLKMAKEHQARLRANGRAWEHFQSCPPWYQRQVTFWIVSAKKEETRQRRLQTLIDRAARGELVPPLTRPEAKTKTKTKTKKPQTPAARSRS